MAYRDETPTYPQNDCRFVMFGEQGMVAEASDLGMGFAPRRFRIEMTDSGTLVTYLRKRTERDADNDVTHWEFEPVGTDIEAQCAPQLVTVLND